MIEAMEKAEKLSAYHNVEKFVAICLEAGLTPEQMVEFLAEIQKKKK